ncbi:unnamed protein product [Pedinophyceae sp. YPF-701]|nr:unnamed protein product [Pedinophyceae sp. YPF-701]
MGRGESSSKRVIGKEEWEAALEQEGPKKEDVNRLIMDFLVSEGYLDAAKAFSEEASVRLPQDLGDLPARTEIRSAVQNGRIADAMERVAELDSEVLEESPALRFRLHQQAFVELIRSGDADAALEYAQEFLAPQGEENEAFLEELERTVALLAFEDRDACPLGSLLDVGQRQESARALNSALLTKQSLPGEPRLVLLLKMMLWAQKQLEEKATFPQIKDLATAQLDGEENV